MKSMISVLSALIAVTLLAGTAEARRDLKRERRQQNRIAEGVASGELTKHEAKRLHRQQLRIDRAQLKANRDGVVTPGEKAKLEKMQDRASGNIYRQKHDGQQQPNNAAQPAAPAAPAAPAEPAAQ